MKSNRRSKKASMPSAGAAPRPQGHSRRFEWPLLVFPAAVLATLVALYAVNRSIRHQMAVRPSHVDTESGSASDHAGKASATTTATIAEKNAKPAHKAGIDPLPNDKPAAVKEPPATAKEKPELETREPAVQDGVGKPQIEGLEGPARIIALLKDAIQQNDHARIKQCLDDLVALGDRGIARLTQVIASEQGEAGMWAAEALARIGSPLATATLLETLANVKEGLYKEQLAKRVAGINNHDSWPVLLDNVLSTADATVLRAAGDALSRMANKPVVDELLARFEAAGSEQDIERIANIISKIRSPGATETLISLAGDVASAPQDALARAAIEGLGNIGDPQAVSYLMRKLEAAPPGESGYLVETISQIKGPQAQDALLYAAAGNREVSADNGRTAAIHALKNYPDARTCALLEQIVATEQNASVVAAASRTLEDIRRTSPHVIANSQSLVKKDPYAPSELIKK